MHRVSTKGRTVTFCGLLQYSTPPRLSTSLLTIVSHWAAGIVGDVMGFLMVFVCLLIIFWVRDLLGLDRRSPPENDLSEDSAGMDVAEERIDLSALCSVDLGEGDGTTRV